MLIIFKNKYMQSQLRNTHSGLLWGTAHNNPKGIDNVVDIRHYWCEIKRIHVSKNTCCARGGHGFKLPGWIMGAPREVLCRHMNDDKPSHMCYEWGRVWGQAFRPGLLPPPLCWPWASCIEANQPGIQRLLPGFAEYPVYRSIWPKFKNFPAGD